MALKFTSGLTLNVDAGGAISDISADTQRNSVPTEAGLINVLYVLSSISLPSCHIFFYITMRQSGDSSNNLCSHPTGSQL